MDGLSLDIADGEFMVLAGPPDFEDASLADPDWARMPVTADPTEALGSEIHVMFSLPAAPVRHPDLAAGRRRRRRRHRSRPRPRRHAMDHPGPRSKITPGSQAEFAVDTAALYFFDPVSGSAIDR